MVPPQEAIVYPFRPERDTSSFLPPASVLIQNGALPGL
jgi:hypothetical protein